MKRIWFCRVIIFLNSSNTLMDSAERHLGKIDNPFLGLCVLGLVFLFSVCFVVAVEDTFSQCKKDFP